MTAGEMVVKVRLDDETSARLEAINAVMDEYSRALPGIMREALRGQQDQTIPAALLGAAAAAVLLPTPVSRRRLLFPWLGRQAAR